jgi:hypothetical protein
MAEVLNPYLYACLRRAFGSVKVANQGMAMSPPPISVPDMLNPKKMHLDVHEFGEYYRVNCQFCSDTRHRLYVNHMFGRKDLSGRKLMFLAVCFNEGCLADENNKEEFRDMLRATDDELEVQPLYRGKEVDPSKAKIRWPGPCRNLTELSRGHRARQYVGDRGLDPDRLGRYYGLSFCLDSIYHLARERLVIPVYWRGKLVGWQTRYVGELPWKDPEKKHDLPPKYWTMPNFPRGRILPNFDSASKFRTGVLVEGWFDTYSFGPMAMPVLGNTITEQQISTFSGVWSQRGRSGVWLLDPETRGMKSTEFLINRLRGLMSGQLAVVWLPKGTDPGSLDRAFLRDYVEEHADDQGVKVSWDKV